MGPRESESPGLKPVLCRRGFRGLKLPANPGEQEQEQEQKQEQKQIPFGNDRKKGNSNSNCNSNGPLQTRT